MLRAISFVLALIVLLAARGAQAHPAPAEAPDFGTPPCIEIADKTAHDAFDVAYTLAMDDTAFGPLDIPMPDAKTHQFFAWSGALFSDSTGWELQPFDAQAGDAIAVPLWINAGDVMRAALASGDVAGAMFVASDVPADAVLVQNSALDGRFARITADDARVPITLEQARTKVHWNLAGVAPGVYTIAAYIFSPPYNGWAIRPGLVKVTDAQHDVPAAVIDPINDFVFSYQGRKLSACIDAPPGTRLEVAVRVEEHPELGYVPALAEREVSSGPLALCLRNPMAELSGSLRVRFELTAPDGTKTLAYSPDRLTALSGMGECVESDTVCCDFERKVKQDDDDPVQAGTAGMAVDADDGAGGERGGCSVAEVRATRVPAAQALVLAWLALVLALRVRRRARACVALLLLVLLGACSDATPPPRPRAPPPTPGAAAPAEPLQPTHAHAMSLQPEMAAIGAARYYREQGKLEEALSQLDRLAERYPDPALPAERAAERAATLCALGRTEEAKRSLDDLTRFRARPEVIARATAACAPAP